MSKDFQTIFANINPIEILSKWEKEDMKIAKKGLKEGFLDTISSLKHYPKEISLEIDIILKENNLPGIRKLTGIIRNTHKKVLKNKRIKNIDEYYIIKEIVVDLTEDITDSERKILSDYMGVFENNIK